MDIIEVAKTYVEWDPNRHTRKEVEVLLEQADTHSLRAILSSRLAFGTAGLRGPMGAGYNRMNDLVILQTAQGLVRYLSEQGCINKRLVIGYDHRTFGGISSRGIARIASAVFLYSGYKVFLLEGFVPTPFVAFAVTNLQCAAGIMVTASHNPKQDNGFKVYWGNGAQIIPPHDTGIADAIQRNLAPWPLAAAAAASTSISETTTSSSSSSSYDYSDSAVLSHPQSEDVTVALADAYFSAIARLSNFHATVPAPLASSTDRSPIKFVYTAMHGVGCQWVRRAFEVFKHPAVLAVPSQAEPDPDFPTVVFPNPEEKGALDAAMAFAETNRCTLILANDPDADRLAVAERIAFEESDAGTAAAGAAGQWYVFTGNEIGILLGHWQIQRWKKSTAAGTSAGTTEGVALPIPAVITTVVSSRMLKTVAEKEGVLYRESLTGFKWLGNTALGLIARGTPVLFSYEEALGYCVGDVISDKDGVSAAAVFMEMANALKTGSEKGSTVKQHLQSLYATYGEFVSYNSYVISRDGAVTDKIFARLRGASTVEASGISTATTCHWKACAGVPITSVKDVTLGLDSTSATGKSDLPVTPESHMIMYQFENGVSVTLRTSGTEPKIKFYTEIAGRPGQPRAEVEGVLRSFVDAVVDEMLQPELNGLAKA